VTVEMIVKKTVTGYRAFLEEADPGETLSTNMLYDLTAQAGEVIREFHEYGSGTNVSAVTTTLTIPNTTDYHYLCVKRRSSAKEDDFFINDSSKETVGYSHNAEKASSGNVQRLRIGNRKEADQTREIFISEVRVSNTARSDAWIKATQQTLDDNLIDYSEIQISKRTLSVNDSKIIVAADNVAEWLSGWDNRKKFTIDSSKIDSSLSDFPVALLLSTSAGTNDEDLTAIFTEIADSDRKKIAVTTSDGTTQCYVEIEVWDSTNKKAALHVKVPTISSSADTELYLYYDSGHADNTTYVGDAGDSPAQNVWDSNFVAVWHMAQNPAGGSGAIKDSTSNANNGTSNGSMTSGDLVDGVSSAKAIDFDGSDDNIQISDASVLRGMQAITVETLIYPRSAGAVNYGKVLDFADGSASNVDRKYRVYYDAGSPRKIIFGAWDSSNTLIETISAGSLTYDDWNLLSFVYDGGTTSTSLRSYMNGSPAETDTPTGNDVSNVSGDTMYIGRDCYATSMDFDGKIGDIRISDTDRSAAWIKATYYTLFDDLGQWG